MSEPPAYGQDGIYAGGRNQHLRHYEIALVVIIIDIFVIEIGAGFIVVIRCEQTLGNKAQADGQVGKEMADGLAGAEAHQV